MIQFKNLLIKTCDKVYVPAEDTLLLARNLKVKRNACVLEIGTGSGLVALEAAQKAAKVVATDINPYAVDCARENVELNKVSNMEVLQGDLFQPVKGEKFDLILFNTPYLPTREEEIVGDMLDVAWNGGKDGRKVIDVFLDEVKLYLKEGGSVQLVQSSLSDNEKTLQKMEDLGFEVEITAIDKFFFEEVVVISGTLK